MRVFIMLAIAFIQSFDKIIFSINRLSKKKNFIYFRTLSIISSDTHPLEVYSAEFIIDNGQLGFIATDSQRNLR